MIGVMMIPIHAIASSDEGRHSHAFRAVHNFLKKWLLEEKPQNKRPTLDILEAFDVQDHYINLYAPDLIAGSVKKEALCDERSDESEGEENENDPLIQTTVDLSTSLLNLRNAVNLSPQISGAHKAFINAVNASTIRSRTEQSSSLNTAKNLGELSF